MTPHPRLSRAGIELVERFEGLRRHAARLDGGGWTIGYGHTLSAREGAEVTADEAESLLIYDLDRVARRLDELIFAPLNRNQFNALVAFAFNVGVENFRASAVLKRVNEGAYLQAAAALELWRRSAFQGDDLVVDGLVRRRAAEKLLFLTPPEGFPATPTPVVRPAYDGQAADLRALGRGLADVASLHVPLSDEHAVAERTEELEEATRKVTARLQNLFPDEPPVVAEPAPAPEPAPEPKPEPEPEPEPDPEPPPPPLAVAAPASRLAEPAPAPGRPAPGAAEPEPARDLGRRTDVEAVHDDAGPSAPPSYVSLLVGSVGALMFIAALLTMVYGKATVLNLAIGLLGVVCMAPAALRLLMRLFGERSDDASR